MAEVHRQQPQRQLRGGGRAAGRLDRDAQLPVPGGPALIYTRAEIAAFLAALRDGEFDDL